MIRNLIAASVALFVFVAGVGAGEYKGKITKCDAEKNTITVNIRKDKTDKTGEDKTFTVAKDAKFCTVKAGAEETLTEGLKNELFAKVGAKGGPGAATLVTKGEGKDEVVTEIKITIGKKKKKTDK